MKNVVELLGIEKLKNCKNDQNLEANFHDEILKVPFKTDKIIVLMYVLE